MAEPHDLPFPPGEVITPQDPRYQEAKRKKQSRANGKDPQGEKLAVRATASETFGAIAQRYIEYRIKKGDLRPSSLYSTTLYLTKYCKRLHGLKIEAITRREIASVLGTIAGDRGKVAADRAGSAISAMFAWAIGEGLVDANPVVGVTKHAGVTSRDRVLDDKELAAIWLALDDDDYGRIVKLLILTGQRKTESAPQRNRRPRHRVARREDQEPPASCRAAF